MEKQCRVKHPDYYALCILEEGHSGYHRSYILQGKTLKTKDLQWESSEEDYCHCGRAVHYQPGLFADPKKLFSRGLCYDCSLVRCDVEPGACR